MTVTAQTPRSGPYNGDGATLAFNYTFLINDETELVVVLANTTTGVETIQTLTTHYTVAGVGVNAGGSVTFVTAPTGSETVSIRRVTSRAQPIDLENRGAVVPDELETSLDALTKQMQDLQEQMDRAIKIPVSDGAATGGLPTAAARAGQFLAAEVGTGNIVFQETAPPVGGGLLAANNLSEIDSPSTALSNLGGASLSAANTLAGAQTLSSTLNVAGALDVDGLVRLGNPDIDAHLGATPPALVAASPASVSAGLSWTPIDSVELYVIRNGDVAVDIVSNTASSSIINFSTQTDEDAMQIDADHATDTMIFRIAGSAEMTMDVNGLTVHGALAAETIAGNWIATQADAEAGTGGGKVMTPQRTQQAIDNNGRMAKAWAHYDSKGTFTIHDSFNVSSITDTGTGDHTINFTNNMSSANYAALGGCKGEDNKTVASGANSMIWQAIAHAVGSVGVITHTQSNLVLADADLCNFAAFE